jgi:predicted DNA-binding transcriptional regulator AlpA
MSLTKPGKGKLSFSGAVKVPPGFFATGDAPIKARQQRLLARPSVGEFEMESETRQETSGERTAGRDGNTVDTFPRLLDVKDVAAMLKCSSRHVWRLADSGRMPRPLKLCGIRRWSQKAVADWIAAGCPDQRKTGGVK